jgi:arginine decarboxylase-like protein
MLRRFFYVFVSLSTLHGYTALREYLEDVFWETGLSVYGVLGNFGIFTLKDRAKARGMLLSCAKALHRFLQHHQSGHNLRRPGS